MSEIHLVDSESPTAMLALANCIRAQLRCARNWEEVDGAESAVKARAAANNIFLLD
jgi:hypothetical protein